MPQSPSRQATPVGITMGDPAGIGPEVTIKALGRDRRVLVIGSRAVFEAEAKRLGFPFDPGLVDDEVQFAGRLVPGRVNKACGRAALACLERGAELLRGGEISALVTAPVSKEALRLAGFRWPGQTEFLAERLHSRQYAMLAWTPRFKAVFVTIHVPLSRVARLVTARAVLEKTALLHEFLQREGKRRPGIAVMAFNPHGAEFGRGEEKEIAEGVSRAQTMGIRAWGPLPADALVANAASFDGCVAMYHDQAMIPAKLLGSGVNVTLGLDRVRTSPLHGTAFDIAGQGRASAGSMKAAIRLARKLAR